MRNALRRTGMAACLAFALLLPAAGNAGLLSGLGDTLSRLSAATAQLYAQAVASLDGSLARLGAGLKGTIDRSGQSLGQLFAGLNGSYLAPTAGTTSFTAYIQQGGTARRYIAIRPSVAVPGAPVLILLHAHGVSPELMANITRAGRLAVEYGAWVFLPEAEKGEWNSDPANSGADDVGFLSQLATAAVNDYKLDARHLYFAGYSSGGFMSQRMACERNALIAGIGVVAATMRPDVAATCKLTHPTPVALMNGTSDLIVLYNGYIGNASIRSAPETAVIWANQNGCDVSKMQTTTLPNKEQPIDKTTVALTRFTGCPSGAAVRLYTIDKGGHTWPGSQDGGYTAYLGKTSGDVDATEELWQFLIGYSLP